jgi:hypothetical protein
MNKPWVPDIRSPKGQANEVHTEKVYSVLMKHFKIPGAVLERLHDTHPADCYINNQWGKHLLLIEIKSRKDFTEAEFYARHNGEWLISNSKLLDNIPIAREEKVPFMGAMHIVQSKVILLKTIWKNGHTTPHVVRNTQTQKCINGGTKDGDNAFIPMRDAMRFTYD